MPKSVEAIDLHPIAVIAISNMQKDAVIDLLDDYCGVSCYADRTLSQLQDDLLTAYKQEMVKKEIAVHLLAYNLVRAVMAQAACLGHVLPRQLSFKAALQLIRAFEESLRHAPQARLALRQGYLMAGIAQIRLPDRPGRIEPRVVKRRPNQHALMTQPRHVLKAAILKQRQAHYGEGLR